ncbi:hypothetical protein HRbin03_00097 [archaeon HR03]|nr:hypothetical protein HRbin03_00097 [archaeon HR03]
MYRRRLVEAQALRDISLDTPVGVLVDSRWNQASPFLEHCWHYLDGGEKHHPDVGLLVEAEDCTHPAEVNLSSHFQDGAVHPRHELCVSEDEGFVGVEADRGYVDHVVERPVGRVLECQPTRLLEKLLVIGHLDVDVCAESFLQPFCEEEGDDVADMHGAAGASAGVEIESSAGFMVVENMAEVSVGEEDSAPQHVIAPASGFFQTLHQLIRDKLCAKLSDKPLVVDRALNLPRRNTETLPTIRQQPTPPKRQSAQLSKGMPGLRQRQPPAANIQDTNKQRV